MNIQRQSRVFGFIVVASFFFPGIEPDSFGSLIPARKIILVGENAPGINNATFDTLWGISINETGQTSFLARTTPNLASGIWTESFGSLAFVTRENLPAPGGAAGQSIRIIFPPPRLSASGRVVFEGYTTFTPTISLPIGVWEGNSTDGITKVALAGTSADIPGITANIIYIGKAGATFVGGPAVNAQGSSAFFANLNGSIRVVLKSVAPTGMSMVARAGTLAPGSTKNFSVFGRTNFTIIPTLNNNNDVAFYATLSPAGSGVWAEASGALQLIAENGTLAPGSTDVFSDFNDPRINDAGKLAFAASLSAAAAADTGIWSSGLGALTLVAREGEQAAGLGAGVVYGELVNPPLLLHDGRIAMSGPITGSGVDVEHDTALWVQTAQGLQLVAREGDQIPGMGEGLQFGEFGVVRDYDDIGASNSNGIIVFYASLRGPGITIDNDGSLWTVDQSAQLRKVIMTGDSIEIQSGDVRTVREVVVEQRGSGEDGFVRGLNDLNDLALQIYFTDGTAGFFVINVAPAPNGDMNCDGSRNTLDIAALVLALIDPENYEIEYPNCSALNGDFMNDSTIDGRDIGGFVALMLEP